MTEPTTLSRIRGSRVYFSNLVAPEVAQQMTLTNLVGYIKLGQHRVARRPPAGSLSLAKLGAVARDSTEIISLMC